MISAIILAAGQSKRMGQPKMLLPWGRSTVIEQVITTFLNAGIEDVTVVTGGAREQVEGSISQYPVRTIHNNDFEAGEMLASSHCSLRVMPEGARAVLILRDHRPQVQEDSVRLICEAYRD